MFFPDGLLGMAMVGGAALMAAGAVLVGMAVAKKWTKGFMSCRIGSWLSGKPCDGSRDPVNIQEES